MSGNIPNVHVVKVEPEPDVYTALLAVAAVVLVAAIVIVGWNLMSADGYGMLLQELFSPLETLK